MVSVGIKLSIWSVKSRISRNCKAPGVDHNQIPSNPPTTSKAVPNTGILPMVRSAKSNTIEIMNFNVVFKTGI